MTKPITPTRQGKALQTLKPGHPRRMADAKNAFRKMDDAQRVKFLRWIGLWAEIVGPCCVEAPLDGDGMGTIAVKIEVVDALLHNRAWEK
jgi:hypothetical protein